MAVNSTTKRIIAGIVVGLAMLLVTQVFINTNRVTALEAQVKGLEMQLEMNGRAIDLNRTENREEHLLINNKLDKLLLRGEGVSK